MFSETKSNLIQGTTHLKLQLSLAFINNMNWQEAPLFGSLNTSFIGLLS